MSSSSTGRPISRRMGSPASSRPAADSPPSWPARPRARRCSTVRLAATSADGRSSMRRALAAGICRAPRLRILAAFTQVLHKVWRESTKRRLFSKLYFHWGRSGSAAQLWLILAINTHQGTTAKGGTAGGWSLRMLRGARGRAAIARGTRIAAFAVSAAAALWVASLAAEPAANGQAKPAANGQAKPAANGRQAEPNGNGRLVGSGTGSGTMDEALIQAYQNNPQLNSQRSATRAIDENVPTALAGYRPRVSGTASLTDQYLDQLTRTTGTTAGIP